MIASLAAWLAARVGGKFVGMAARAVFWLLVLLAGLAPFWFVCHRCEAATAAKYQKQIAEERVANLRALAASVEAVKATERAAAKASLEATEARMRAEKEENDALSRDITALRGSTLRLRNRLAAGRCSDADVRADAAAPGRVAQARTGGLLPADAEFLLRFGREADSVARKLSEAQVQLRACQKLTHAPQ